jgi:hypothetical protein
MISVVQAGVEIRFFTQAWRTLTCEPGRKVSTARSCSNIEGLRYVAAKTFIDATGDADIG